MAGSWNHMVTEAGEFQGTRLLDNLGDCYEALEECYGMVWWLARDGDASAALTSPQDQRTSALARIEDARQHYKDGLEMGNA
jgi:hypothetical protein